MFWAYVMIFVENIFIALLTPTIASWYNLTPEGNYLAKMLIWYHSACLRFYRVSYIFLRFEKRPPKGDLFFLYLLYASFED